MKPSLLLLLIFVANSALATSKKDTIPESMDYFTRAGVDVIFIKLSDPLNIHIKLKDSGEVIETSHSDEDYEALSEWKKGRDLRITYTIADGVEVVDTKTGLRFKLRGVISSPNHPIDAGFQECIGKYFTTFGMKSCGELEYEAWDAELNRAYKALGGSKNSELKTAQLTWIKYRDAQTTYLTSEYSSRHGTIWQLVLMDQVTNITRRQAELLLSVKEW